MIEFIKKILKKYREQISYLFFGALTTLVSNLSFNLLFYVIFGETMNVVANVISEFLAITFAYVTNKIFVFKSSTPDFKSFIRELITFYALRVAGSLFIIIGMSVLVDGLKLEAWICKISLSIVVIILNYVFSKLIIFRKGKQTKCSVADDGANAQNYRSENTEL